MSKFIDCRYSLKFHNLLYTKGYRADSRKWAARNVQLAPGQTFGTTQETQRNTQSFGEEAKWKGATWMN